MLYLLFNLEGKENSTFKGLWLHDIYNLYNFLITPQIFESFSISHLYARDFIDPNGTTTTHNELLY